MPAARPLYRLPAEAGRAHRGKRYVFVALALAVVAGWALTQAAAERLQFHPSLGPALVDPPQGALPPVALGVMAAVLAVLSLRLILRTDRRRLGWVLIAPTLVAAALSRGPLYPPFALLLWRRRFSSVPYVEPFLSRLQLALALTCLALLLVAFVAAALQSVTRADVYGSARWADRRDLRQAGVLRALRGHSVVGPSGLFLGCWQDPGGRFTLFEDGDTHTLLFAPTRSGKGVSIVIPNLLQWQGSALVVDVKGELFQLTSGYRSRELGNRCLRFDPTLSESARYNPLAEIRLGTLHEVRDAQNVADILVDPNGDRTRSHWDRTAHALLTALILHVLYTQPEKTLGGCASFLSRPGVDVSKTLRSMVVGPHTEGKPHPVIASIIQAVLDKAEEERSGVISTALSFLDLYRDPLIRLNTATSDFRISDLMNGDRPLTLYLTLPPSDLSRTRSLIRLVLNQYCRRLTEQLEFENGRPVPHYRHRLLLLMDEFPALGQLAFFAESLAYLAGYGVRCVLVAQDLAQLQSVYGPKESLTSNCHVRIAFAPNKPETAELLSQMAGQMTVHQERLTRRVDGPLLGGGSLTPSETQRRLITPDEAMRLPPDETLIFIAGLPPVRALKAPYYRDPELQRRAAYPPALD
jgi:type IV secretion system protein VirD4